MSAADELDVIREASDELAEMAEAHPDATIAVYDWDMMGLVVHTGRVFRRTSLILGERLTDRPKRPPAPTDAAIPWFRESVDQMIQALESTPDEVEVFTFDGSGRPSFWRERMLMESVIHRWDAQNAVGEPQPIPPDLAERGIEEFGRMWARYLGPHDTVTFAAQDTDHAWLLESREEGSRLGEGRSRPDLIAPISDLYLWLMGRVSLDVVPSVTKAINGMSRPPD